MWFTYFTASFMCLILKASDFIWIEKIELNGSRRIRFVIIHNPLALFKFIKEAGCME